VSVLLLFFGVGCDVVVFAGARREALGVKVERPQRSEDERS
jgi:hypothetical protein